MLAGSFRCRDRLVKSWTFSPPDTQFQGFRNISLPSGVSALLPKVSRPYLWFLIACKLCLLHFAGALPPRSLDTSGARPTLEPCSLAPPSLNEVIHSQHQLKKKNYSGFSHATETESLWHHQKISEIWVLIHFRGRWHCLTCVKCLKVVICPQFMEISI